MRRMLKQRARVSESASPPAHPGPRTCFPSLTSIWFSSLRMAQRCCSSPRATHFIEPVEHLKRAHRDTHLLVSITVKSGKEILLLDIDVSCLIVLNRAQLSLTLCDPMDCSPPGSSIHGMSQARILEWVAVSCSRGSSLPRD